MLSIDFVKKNKKLILEASKNKGYLVEDSVVEKIVFLDNERIKLIQNIQDLNKQRKLISSNKLDELQRKKAIELKSKLKKSEAQLKEIESKLNILLYKIPNIPLKEVKVGKDENDNQILRLYGKPTKFDFKIKDHLEIGEYLNLIDVKRAAKISGTRFAYLKNEAVILEFALIRYTFDQLIKQGFEPVIPPVLIKRGITDSLGYWQAGEHEQYYWINDDSVENNGYYLVGTAEHTLVPMLKDEILNKKTLPQRYAGFSTCFRREAGTYGKDTRGIFRVHQFDKVEMISFTTEEDDEKEFEYLLSIEEKLYKNLDIPFRVTKMCTAELGFPAAKKVDIEAWIPSQNKYREVTSVSTTTVFQARRLKIRYKSDDNQIKYNHILNATACAIGRTIITILENNQQKDGSVNIPKVLQKYTGFKKISKS